MTNMHGRAAPSFVSRAFPYVAGFTHAFTAFDTLHEPIPSFRQVSRTLGCMALDIIASLVVFEGIWLRHQVVVRKLLSLLEDVSHLEPRRSYSEWPARPLQH